MIKNTSGLAVQPCRLHERFYYHARLLYYILRQKARGFFARGCSPLATPICEGAGAPSGASRQTWLLLPRAGAPPCTRGSFLRDGSPSPQRCEGFPLCTPQSGRSAPRPRVTFVSRRKSPKACRGCAPGPRCVVTALSALAPLCSGSRRAASCVFTGSLASAAAWGTHSPAALAAPLWDADSLRFPFPLFRKKLLRARWEAQAVHSR